MIFLFRLLKLLHLNFTDRSMSYFQLLPKRLLLRINYLNTSYTSEAASRKIEELFYFSDLAACRSRQLVTLSQEQKGKDITNKK